MFAGVSFLWITFLFLFRENISVLLRKIHLLDIQRFDLLQQSLHKHFVFQTKERVFIIARSSFLIFLALSLIFDYPFVALAIVFSYLFFPSIWVWTVGHVRQQKFQKQLLLFIPSLSSMLRSGQGLERSFSELKNIMQPPISEEISLVLRQVQLGNTLEDALQKMATRFFSENFAMFVHAIILSRKLGASVTETIDHISKNILEKEKLKAQIQSLTSQGKMQAYIAVLMPIVVAVAVNMISPGYFDVIFSTFIGKCSLAFCAVSMTTGLIWIYRITHKEYL